MSLIERAANRLEELRRAGAEIPLPKSAAPAPLASRLDHAAQGRDVASTTRPQSPIGPSARSLSVDVTLDFLKLASAGFVTPDIPRSQIADQFRILKRPLLANVAAGNLSARNHGNLIMVTSSVPGEGKTFSAVNLAMSMATELDRTVLLVDADVARPALPNLLGIRSEKGLLDVLESSSVDLSDVLLRTNVEKLSILPSGRPHSHATELLASQAMANLLDEVSSRYADRIVIFDSPPLLVTTEARVLASQMGQIVFVVHAEKTLQSDVIRALATIDSCPIKLMVLNQARAGNGGPDGYGYGYGYGW